MKKTLLVLVALISISMTSCKKDWDCVCTDNTTGEKETYPIGNSRRPEASIACDFYEGYGQDCSLD